MILVDGITRALLVNRFATVGELKQMSYRELSYFYKILEESAS